MKTGRQGVTSKMSKFSVHDLALPDDEELPLPLRRHNRAALVRLLAALPGYDDMKPATLERKLISTARKLFYAPDFALDLLTEELTDYPPSVIRESDLLRQILAIMKTDAELEMLLEDRQKRRVSESERKKRVTTIRRKRLSD